MQSQEHTLDLAGDVAFAAPPLRQQAAVGIVDLAVLILRASAWLVLLTPVWVLAILFAYC